MPKIKVYLVFLIALVLVGVSTFMLRDFLWKKSAESSVNYNLTEGKKVSDTCYLQDKIEFYTYADPEGEKRNNKFGLYIYAENKDFFELAEDLVNSNGGDWGYVLLPYNVEDHDFTKWSNVFDELRQRHLIPVVQLWGLEIDDYKQQTEKAARFLDSFIWPVRQMYISVYNEPNDAKFWFGEVNPEQYAEVLDYTIEIFKEENEDFFIMNGALNISASSSEDYVDAFEFLTRMHTAKPTLFEQLDGWASHPYPQPNFSGDPYAKGRWSVRAYEEELRFLKEKLGVDKELPVFITETGWAHAEGKEWNATYLPVEKVGENIKSAYEDVWLPDDRVVAVMPFTIRYDPPFDHFSWVNEDNIPYLHYETVKQMKKTAGNPVKLEKKVLDVVNCDQ